MSSGNVTMLVENSTLEQEVADTVIFWIEAVITPGISIGGLLGRQLVVQVVVGEWVVLVRWSWSMLEVVLEEVLDLV